MGSAFFDLEHKRHRCRERWFVPALWECANLTATKSDAICLESALSGGYFLVVNGQCGLHAAFLRLYLASVGARRIRLDASVGAI